MLARMETLSLVGSSAQLNGKAAARLLLTGIRYCQLDLVRSFWSFACNWLLEILCVPGVASANSLIGGIAMSLRSMQPQQELSLTRRHLEDSIVGCRRVVADLDRL